jgi:hypothetical protein
MAVIELFAADCPECAEAERIVRALACPRCEVQVVSVATREGNARAGRYGVARVPAVAIDGVLADCCRGGQPDRAHLAARMSAA